MAGLSRSLSLILKTLCSSLVSVRGRVGKRGAGGGIGWAYSSLILCEACVCVCVCDGGGKFSASLGMLRCFWCVILWHENERCLEWRIWTGPLSTCWAEFPRQDKTLEDSLCSGRLMVMEEMWDLFSARFFASLKYIRGALFAFALSRSLFFRSFNQFNSLTSTSYLFFIVLRW